MADVVYFSRFLPMALAGVFLLPACTDCVDVPTPTPTDAAETTPPTQEVTPTGVVVTPFPTPPLDRPPAEMPLIVADSIFKGDQIGDQLGLCVSGLGDLNGDGLADFGASAPMSDARYTDGGRIYLVFGATSGWQWQNDVDTLTTSLDGEARSDLAGMSLTGVGDVDGDGLDELLVGAPGHDERDLRSGRVYLIMGRELGWYAAQNLGSADVVFDGLAEDRLGEFGTLSGGGDFNGDGLADMAFGAWGAGGDERGRVYVVYGRRDPWSSPVPPTSVAFTVEGEATGDRFGYSVSLTTDVNLDGYADLVVGAPDHDVGLELNFGAIYIFYGHGGDLQGEQAVASDYDARALGSVSGEELGVSVAVLGDVDNTGSPDIGVGAWGNNEDDPFSDTRGKYYLFSVGPDEWNDAPAAQLGAVWVGENIGDYVGRPMVPAGDVDQDGIADFMMGSYLRDYPDTDAGNGHLFFGWSGPRFGVKDTLQAADVRFVGEGERNFAGYSLDGAGDINGDGFDDLIIGASGVDGGSDVTRGGRVYLVFGRRLFTR